MAKARFPLKMANNELVKTLEELKKHFDLASVLRYYADRSLIQWLTDRYHEDEAKKIEALDPKASDFKKSLCEILGVDYSKIGLADYVSLTDISDRNKRRERLKDFTSDNKILAAVDRVAFTQEELDKLLDKVKEDFWHTTIILNIEIYLCGDRFKIPDSIIPDGTIGYVTFIGVNNPKVDILDWVVAEGIKFQNVDPGIEDIMRQAKESTDPVEAVNLWCKAAELGNAEAQNQLGICYGTGEGVEQDYKEAFKWYHKAAEQGDTEAQEKLGRYYYNGFGVERDYKEAVKWFRKAAEQGDTKAQDWLGYCYYNGEGVEKDKTEGDNWYRKAAEQIRKAAEQGVAQAQLGLGYYYSYGKGVDQDNNEAVKWFSKAAEQGNAEAQTNLGNCYIDGKGIAKDDTEAVKWFRKAAEQDYAWAQRRLGHCYHDGIGVEQDYTEAVKWFRKAAEQGDRNAQLRLGICYKDGKGVEPNDEWAIKWLSKAADQGDEEARKELIKIAPTLFKLSDVIKRAIGNEYNLFCSCLSIEWDTGNIHIPIESRDKVDTTILEKFGAWDVWLETCLIEDKSGLWKKMEDKGRGIIHMRLPNINPEVKEDLIKAFDVRSSIPTFYF